MQPVTTGCQTGLDCNRPVCCSPVWLYVVCECNQTGSSSSFLQKWEKTGSNQTFKHYMIQQGQHSSLPCVAEAKSIQLTSCTYRHDPPHVTPQPTCSAPSPRNSEHDSGPAPGDTKQNGLHPTTVACEHLCQLIGSGVGDPPPCKQLLTVVLPQAHVSWGAPGAALCLVTQNRRASTPQAVACGCVCHLIGSEVGNPPPCKQWLMAVGIIGR